MEMFTTQKHSLSDIKNIDLGNIAQNQQIYASGIPAFNISWNNDVNISQRANWKHLRNISAIFPYSLGFYWEI